MTDLRRRHSSTITNGTDFENETPDERRKRFLLEVDAKHERAHDKDDSTKRFKYLLGLSALFRKFINLNASKDPAFKKRIREIDSKTSFKESTKKERVLEEEKPRKKKTQSCYKMRNTKMMKIINTLF